MLHTQIQRFSSWLFFFVQNAIRSSPSPHKYFSKHIYVRSCVTDENPVTERGECRLRSCWANARLPAGFGEPWSNLKSDASQGGRPRSCLRFVCSSEQFICVRQAYVSRKGGVGVGLKRPCILELHWGLDGIHFVGDRSNSLHARFIPTKIRMKTDSASRLSVMLNIICLWTVGKSVMCTPLNCWLRFRASCQSCAYELLGFGSWKISHVYASELLVTLSG